MVKPSASLITRPAMHTSELPEAPVSQAVLLLRSTDARERLRATQLLANAWAIHEEVRKAQLPPMPVIEEEAEIPACTPGCRAY